MFIFSIYSLVGALRLFFVEFSWEQVAPPLRERESQSNAFRFVVLCRTGEWVRMPEVVSLRRWRPLCRRPVPLSDGVLRPTRLQQMHSPRRFGTPLLQLTITVIVKRRFVTNVWSTDKQLIIDQSMIDIDTGGNCCVINVLMKRWNQRASVDSHRPANVLTAEYAQTCANLRL